MKFDRMERYEPFDWTPRKLAHATKRPEREAAKIAARYPLLAPVMDKPAPCDPAIEAANRAEKRRRAESRTRDLYARVWKEARRDAQASEPAVQAAIRAAWAAWRGPRTATYFRYVVDVATGVQEQRSAAFRAREAESAAQYRAAAQAQPSLFASA